MPVGQMVALPTAQQPAPCVIVILFEGGRDFYLLIDCPHAIRDWGWARTEGGRRGFNLYFPRGGHLCCLPKPTLEGSWNQELKVAFEPRYPVEKYMS